MLRPQQQQMLLRSELDRVYEDRSSDAISDELWTTKSGELQEELRRVRAEIERHEAAEVVRRPTSGSSMCLRMGASGRWLGALDDFRNLIQEAA